jgi:hypothetical protein
MSRRAGDSLPGMFFMGILLLLAVWALDDMRAWARTWFGPAKIARTCQPPSEHEQLHIVVTLRDGRLHSECMFVGTRGTYARRTVRVSAP